MEPYAAPQCDAVKADKTIISDVHTVETLTERGGKISAPAG